MKINFLTCYILKPLEFCIVIGDKSKNLQKNSVERLVNFDKEFLSF